MAHPDLDRLVDFCVKFAQDQLKKRGAFYPFAATVWPSGELTPLAIYSGDDSPKPQALIDEFTELLKNLAQSGEAHATALCYDSRVSTAGNQSEKKDAIAVSLEHSNGEAVIVYLPYRKKLFGGYNYDSIIGVAGGRKFFT